MQQISQDFSDEFRDYVTFSFVYDSLFNHQTLNNADLMDESYLNYLQEIEKKRLLNDTIVILMSDHGLRVTEFRSTVIGAMEDLLPYLYILLPYDFEKR